MTENAPPGNGKGSASLHTSEALNDYQSRRQAKPAPTEISATAAQVNLGSGTSCEDHELQAAKWKRRRCFVRDGELPEHALTWPSSKQRTAKICAWRTAVIGRYSESARPLRIAWTIEGLAVKKGYAYCSDSYLSKTLGIHTTGIQRGLTELERDGVIVRASVFTGAAEPERRIWLSSKITGGVPATTAGRGTRYGDSEPTRYDSGTESKQYTLTSTTRPSSTQVAAKKAAELRQRSALKRGAGAMSVWIRAGDG